MAVGRAHARAPLAALHSSSSPASAHVAAAIASRRLRIPWVADFRDPWVENPVDPAMGRIDAWRRRTLEAWIIRTADRVTFATPSLHDAYVRRYPERAGRFSVIENGYDRAELPPLPARGGADDDVRRLVYAGSLYRPAELATFLDGVAAVLDRRTEVADRLRVEFIGSATDACKAVAVSRLARADVASVVTFTPFLPRAEALRRLADADAALTLLGPGPGMAQFIGAKLYDAIGLDRPVVAMLPPGDARDVLAGLDWGIVCDPEPGSVADALERFLDTPPQDRPADPDGRYDRAMLARRLGGLLDELRRGGRGPDAGMSTTTLGRRRGRMMARPAAPSTRTMRAVLAFAIVAGALAAVAYGVTREQLPFVAGGAMGSRRRNRDRALVGLLLMYASLMPWENGAGGRCRDGREAGRPGIRAAYVIHRGTNLRLDTVGPWLWGFVAWACASLLWTAQPAGVVDEAFTLVQLFIVTILVGGPHERPARVRRARDVDLRVLGDHHETSSGSTCTPSTTRRCPTAGRRRSSANPLRSSRRSCSPRRSC